MFLSTAVMPAFMFVSSARLSFVSTRMVNSAHHRTTLLVILMLLANLDWNAPRLLALRRICSRDFTPG